MTIEIKHTVVAADIAEQITKGIQAGLDGFAKGLEQMANKTNIGENKPLFSNQTPAYTQSPASVGALASNKGGSSYAYNNVDNSTNKLTTAIETLTKILNDKGKQSSGGSPLAGYASLPAGERATIMSELKQHQDSAKKGRMDEIRDRSDFYDTRRSENRSRNIMYGALSGAAMAAVYQAGTWGATSGQSTQSVNAGTMNYNSFMGNYLNQQVGNSQSALGMTGIGAGAGIGMMVGGLPGLVAGGLIGGAANYITSKGSEETKALNTLALNQDLASQQLKAFGLSGAGSESLSAKGDMFGLTSNIPVPLSNLQSIMMTNPNYKGSLPYAGEVAMSTRRDIFGGMSDDAKAEFISSSAKLGTITGMSAGEIASTAGHLSSATGMDANKTLDKLYSYQVQYGGDMKSNINKIMNIMQTTGFGQDAASKLVGEYQYNEPMMQQKIAQSKVAPTNMFTGLAYKEIISSQTGLTDMEQIKADYRERVARTQNAKSIKDISPQDMVITQLQQKMFGAMNIDPFVNDIGKMKTSEFSGRLQDVQNTAAQDAMQKMISDALSNISTENMTVNAGTVVINNGMSSSPTTTQTPFTSLNLGSSSVIPPVVSTQGSNSMIPPIVPAIQAGGYSVNRSGQGKLGSKKK